MIIYLTMLVLSCGGMYLASKQNKPWKKLGAVFLAFLPVLFVAGFRYGLGTDYFRRYAYDYARIYNGEVIGNLEFGFQWLMKFTMLFSDKPFLMFFLTSLLIYGCVFYFIGADSKDGVLSVLIFVLLGFFFDSLNIMRQYLSMAIIFVGFHFLLRKKKWLYILSVLLAAAFHTTALIMLVLAVCDYKSFFSWKWFLPLLAVILLLNENLMGIVEFLLKNTRFKVYLEGKLFKGEVSVLFIGENLIFYLLMVALQAKGYVAKSKAANLFLNTQALALLCMCLGSCHMLFIRIAFYFSAFQIVSVPYFVSHCKKTYAITLRDRTVRVDILKALLILCMMFAFYRTNIQSNVNEVLPYQFVFARNMGILFY